MCAVHVPFAASHVLDQILPTRAPGLITIGRCEYRPEACTGQADSSAERAEIPIPRSYPCRARETALHLGRATSMISRELRRNAGTRGRDGGPIGR
jgi:hypothetical protein